MWSCSSCKADFLSRISLSSSSCPFSHRQVFSAVTVTSVLMSLPKSVISMALMQLTCTENCRTSDMSTKCAAATYRMLSKIMLYCFCLSLSLVLHSAARFKLCSWLVGTVGFLADSFCLLGYFVVHSYCSYSVAAVTWDELTDQALHIQSVESNSNEVEGAESPESTMWWSTNSFLKPLQLSA